MNEPAVRRLLADATAFAAFEAPGPALWKSVERAASGALRREQARGAVPAFRVRCDAELNPPGSEGVSFEVVFAPASPRARSLTLRLTAG
jgi:phage tail sheath protein FI